MTYAKHVINSPVPQTQPLPGRNQVVNSAGGYVFPVDDWVRLDRFLILGNEGGTYYASEHDLTTQNVECVVRCIKADGYRTVNRIVEISESGRAPKNEPAILALALCIVHGDKTTKQQVSLDINRVCRTGTHILHFGQYVNGLRGWGRGLRNTIAHWYTNQTPADLAYQVVKYQSRDGWSHKDLLRLSHAHPGMGDSGFQTIFHWIVKGWDGIGDQPHPDEAGKLIWAFEKAKITKNKLDIMKLIVDYRLTREMIPTEWLSDPDIWNVMLPSTGLTALIRNLGNLTKIGLLNGNSQTVKSVVSRITDETLLRKARVHPVQILAAMMTYAQGHGTLGNSTWNPVRQIVDALDQAFYTSFGFLEPSGARTLIALDVSGSMSSGSIAGVAGLTPCIGTAAMSMVTARREQDYQIVAFNTGIMELDISPRQRLDDIVNRIANVNTGGTDCSLPMTWATQHKLGFDVFVIYTDNETYAGRIHPASALQEYRNKMGIAAKQVVVGMTSTGFTIADPNDAGMLDVVGFDTATPQLIADFSKPV